MLNLSKFKSLVVVTDPVEIRKSLEQSGTPFQERSGHAMVMRGSPGTPGAGGAAPGLSSGPPWAAKAAARPPVGGGGAAPASGPQAALMASAIERAFRKEAFEDADIQKLCEMRNVPWNPLYVGRTVPYIASDERVDNMGDIVRQNWDFTQFEKNSPMPYSHKWDMPPVGRVIAWNVVDSEGPALALLGLFATGEDYEWADTVFRLVKSRICVAGSVGFYPRKVVHVTDPTERAELGLGQYGMILDDNVLLEYSPCTLPANPGAIVLNSVNRAGKSLQPRDVFFVRELMRERMGSTDYHRWLELEKALVGLGKKFFPKEKFEVHRQADVPVLLDAPPPRETEETERPAPAPAPAETEAQEAMRLLREMHASVTGGSALEAKIDAIMKYFDIKAEDEESEEEYEDEESEETEESEEDTEETEESEDEPVDEEDTEDASKSEDEESEDEEETGKKPKSLERLARLLTR